MQSKNWDPDGNADDGIQKQILQIKLAKEAKRWDVMVERIHQHLKETQSKRLGLKKKNKADKEAA